MRDIIFLSHANPDDNEFTRWLALRLGAKGYPVWCDLAKLLGGEDFWKNIENELRERTVKLLYVLSRKSNHRNGTLKEMAFANGIAREEGLADFVIPLSVDDLPHTQVNIELNRLISIPFEHGWAAGLNQLLTKLDEDNVPKNPLFSPRAVASWSFAQGGGRLKELFGRGSDPDRTTNGCPTRGSRVQPSCRA